jgi:two-component system phosphate regulon sensor histidine kinase PhoR
MFRRLVLSFGGLLAGLLAVLAFVVVALVEQPALRVRLLLWLGGCGLVAGGAVVAVSARLSRRVLRPLSDLRDAVEALAAGHAGARVFPTDQDEVSRLGESFNHLSERLGERIAQLEQDRQQLRTILSGMVEGVVALDAEQRVLYANDRASQLLEFPPTSVVGRRLWEVVRYRPLLDAVRRAQATDQPQREEVNISGASLRRLTIHAARLPGRPPRGAVLVLHDTSELRRLERLRQEFVANVSHELKTPLSVIKVCVETLLDGAMDDVQHRGHFLERIARQSDRLQALILDLLSLARIESGEELTCAERLSAALRGQVRQQTLTVQPGPPVAVWADEEAIDQILENLLDNALKYTPEGGRIEVRWSATEDSVCIEVADTGIGIPEADLPRIFERFYRVDKARSRELGGTGLGLSIVKHLVQALHGTVRATSQVGVGTTFQVCLPRAEE